MFRILALNDDPHFGGVLKRSLNRDNDLSCDIVSVFSYTHAREAVLDAEPPFDVLLIDQHLVPGPDVTMMLKDLLALNPRSHAVVFTAAHEPEAGLAARRAGAYRYLHKPFDLEELVLALRSLFEWRQTKHERDSLKVLIDIARAAQHTLQLHDLGQLVVEHAPKLGFQRARFWLLDETQRELIGLSQFGNIGVARIAEQRVLVSDSAYISRVLQSREPVIFHGAELGTSYLSRHYADTGFGSPTGDWAGLPLWQNERCLGILMLDNHSRPLRINEEQRQELTLLSEQLAATLERVQLYEVEQRQRQELERKNLEADVMIKIGQMAANRAATTDLETLLLDVRALLGDLMDVSTSFIALFDPQHDQIDIRLAFEHDQPLQRQCFPRPSSGLVGYVITHNEPVFLPTGSDAFRRLHHIRQRRQGLTARCWLGVPLVVENQAIGAIVVQSLEHEHAYTEAHHDILIAFANQVAGMIQTARLKEDADLHIRRLGVLQAASESLMTLVEQSEDHFWHASLTLATAGYALGFNRAMLFLAQGGGTMLRGHMGIGHVHASLVHRDWRRDVRHGHSFASYLVRLRDGSLVHTPVNDLVRQLDFDVEANAGSFAEVVRDKRTVVVEAKHVEQQLPAAFVKLFGTTDYALLPLIVSNKCLGVVVVDNMYIRQPLTVSMLTKLESLLAQVALMYENRRQREANDRLIEVNHGVLAQVTNVTLKETLDSICVAAQLIATADCVVIHPFAANDSLDMPHYDLQNTGHAGLLHGMRANAAPQPNGVTFHVLASGEPLVVEDIQRDERFNQKLPSDKSFFCREGIRSFIAVPIPDVSTGVILGIFYLDYRTPHIFTEQEQRRARSFASLAGATIHTGRLGHEIELQRRKAEQLGHARGRELEILREVQEMSLRPDVHQRQIALTLLSAASKLLGVTDTHVALILREWDMPANPAREPKEVRRQYYLINGELRYRHGQELDNTGITGRAFITGEDQMMDETHPEWETLYKARSAFSLYRGSPQTRSEMDVLIRLENDQVLGLFNVESPVVGAFSVEQQHALRRLATTAALALDNVRRQDNLRGVLDAVQTVVKPSNVQATLEAVLTAARHVAPGVAAVTVWYKDPDSGKLVPGPYFGIRNTQYLRPDVPGINAVLKRVMRQVEPVWAVDALNDKHMSRHFVEDEEIASTAAFSLRVSEGRGESIGAMFFNYRQRHEFSREERALFPILATIAAANVRDATLIEALRKQRLRLQAVQEINEAVGSILDLDDTLRVVLTTLKGHFETRAPKLCIMTFDDKKGTLNFAHASRGFYPPIAQPSIVWGLAVSRDRSIACRVAREALATGKAICENVSDVSSDSEYLNVSETTQSELCLALMSGESRLLGVLVLESDMLDAFTEDEVALVRMVSPSISFALERAKRIKAYSFTVSVANATAWAAEIAHETNDEVGLIRTRLYWLKEKLPPAVLADVHNYIDFIDERAARLAEYARMPHEILAEPLVLDPWLEEQVRKVVGKRPGIDVLFHLGCGVNVLVEAAAVPLETILRHLVRNALEAMGKQGILVVESCTDDGSARILLTNTGGPIPEELHERLFFEPASSKQTTLSGRTRGHGLLFVRWAIEMMGGEIDLVSEPDTDKVTLALTLPLAQESKQRSVHHEHVAEYH